MQDEKLNDLNDILDVFVTRIEEFVNSCDDEERGELFIDTISLKTQEMLCEIEYEMELMDSIGAGRE
mgnify:CR=1 FL=1